MTISNARIGRISDTYREKNHPKMNRRKTPPIFIPQKAALFLVKVSE
jgi:hypothetical protein